jgi:hypothetical protein
MKQIQANHKKWGQDYICNNKTNEFRHSSEVEDKIIYVKPWFEMT